MRRLGALHICIVLLAHAAGTAGADAWDDFANNLATDLAPILALFGEQVTKQFLSESTTMWDNFIFAMAPLGVITAVVSAIRVCSGPSLRAFIGRAQEGGGVAEAELCSSTSRDVCELYHNGAIVRVFGRPKILEIIHDRKEADDELSSGRDPSTFKCGIYSFREYIKIRAPGDSEWREAGKPSGHDIEAPPQPNAAKTPSVSEDDEDSTEFAPNPNLSFNIGIRRSSEYAPWLAAAATFLAQASVLVLGGLITSWGWRKEQELPPKWAFPLMSLGTALLCGGMFFCAFLVENSTKERVFHRTSCDESAGGGKGNLLKSNIYVVQPGNQTIGDQTFDPFLFDDSATPISQYITSWKIQNSSDELRVWSATVMTGAGFVLQFVGLRAMHSVVSVVQLGAILIASVIRASLRTRRLRREDNVLHDRPDEVEGHELDFLALHMARRSKDGKDEGHLSWVVIGPPAMPQTAETTGGLVKKQPGRPPLGLTARTFYYRTRLAELTGQPSIVKSISSTAWGDGLVPARQLAEQLRKAIQSSIKVLYPKGSGDGTITWKLHMTGAEYDQANPSSRAENVWLQLPLQGRKDLSSAWDTIQRHLEAAIGLWTWSIISDPRMEKPVNSSRSSSKVSKASEVPVCRIMAVGLTQEEVEGAEVEMKFWTDDFPLTMQRNIVVGGDPRALGPDVLWHDVGDNGTIRSTSSTTTNSLYRHPSQSLLRLFGWQSATLPSPNGFSLTTGVNHSVSSACAQDLYQQFLRYAVSNLDSVGGQTKALKGSSRFCVQNEVVSGLVECFKESGLGSTQDAFSVILPALRGPLPGRSKLPPATEALPNFHAEAEELRKSGKFQEAEKMLRWAWETAKTLRHEQRDKVLEETMLELGELYRNASSWKQGSHEALVSKGISWMEAQAAKSSSGPLSEISNRYAEIHRRAVDRSTPVTAIDILVPLSEADRTETLCLISQVTELLDRDDDGRTALSWAAQQGWPEVVKAAISIGSVIDSEDKRGRTPLSYAAGHGRVDVVRILLKSGALPTLSDLHRRTPLLHAASGGHLPVMRALFDDPRVSPHDSDQDGQTALHWAAQKGEEDWIKLLLDKDARIDAVDGKKRTPLIVALLNRRKPAAKLLLKLKASHKIKIDGVEAWRWAIGEGEWACAEFMLRLSNGENEKSGADVETRRAVVLILCTDFTSLPTHLYDLVPSPQATFSVCFLDGSGKRVPFDADFFRLAAESDLDVEALLYDKRDQGKYPKTVYIDKKKARGKVIGLLMDQMEECKVTQDVVIAAANNTSYGAQVMRLLLDQRGSEVKLTEEVVKTTAENETQGEAMMSLMLDWPDSEVQVTEEVIKSAAMNDLCGTQIMDLLLERRDEEVKFTEEVVKAAAGNMGGERMLEWLLDQGGKEFKITEEVVKAAVRNPWDGVASMELLLRRRGKEVRVTKGVLKAAMENVMSGERVLRLLRDQRGDEVRIAEDEIKAAQVNRMRPQEA
ncbi:hypothetical protein LX36DRAFT_652618 [Colletotrichum falcatum]|nr:hypothetical protein LX36DRAFT_652618 [Colletotrichum falcatum]